MLIQIKYRNDSVWEKFCEILATTVKRKKKGETVLGSSFALQWSNTVETWAGCRGVRIYPNIGFEGDSDRGLS